VGHTHKDIDQRFSVISRTLKKGDIDSLKELLQLIEKGASSTEAFVKARHMENVWNWKEFITPCLLVGGDALMGITIPQHMRFFMKDGEPRVQYKEDCREEWRTPDGYKCLARLPVVGEKPKLAEVKGEDAREIKALRNFITYKERAVRRLQHVEKNLEAIEETEKLIAYLQEFPARERREATRDPFWPDEFVTGCETTEPCTSQAATKVISNNVENEDDPVLSNLPDAIPRAGYFGPKKNKPSTAVVKRARASQRNVHLGKSVLSHGAIGQSDPFPAFDPFKDIELGHFVALSVTHDDVLAGAPFFLGKVTEFRNRNIVEGEMKVVWYCPRAKAGIRDQDGEWHQQYNNCLHAI
jgi:hypothetical protein